MKMKWKIFVGVLIWIALAGLIHYTSISYQKESPDWNENSPPHQITLHEAICLLGFSLSYPGFLISCFWPIRHGVPMFVEIIPVAEICNDILYALVIAMVIWKFRLKSKKN